MTQRVVAEEPHPKTTGLLTSDKPKRDNPRGEFGSTRYADATQWRAFQQLGLAFAYCPGSWHRLAILDFPMSLGDYRFSPDPDGRWRSVEHRFEHVTREEGVTVVVHVRAVEVHLALPGSLLEDARQVGRRDALCAR